MKLRLSLVMGMLLACAAFGEGISHLELNGNSYSNIFKVYVGAGNRVIILYPGGGTSASVPQLPSDFLESWGIDQGKQAAVKAAIADQDARSLNSAIKNGCFRVVRGTVYDTRKGQSGWVLIRNAKVIQVVSTGVIIDTTPNDRDFTAAFVRNLPDTIGDTDYISFIALPDGSYSYINKLGDDRTIRAYNAGRPCSREEIPETVLSGKKCYDEMNSRSLPQTDVIASLPDSDDLMASGSGFFITDDGYFITNDHVVENARRITIKIHDKVFPAKIVSKSKAHDLALLKVEGAFKAICISTNDADLGQSVFTIGFPDIKLQGTEPKYTDGKISSTSGIKDDPNEYQISVPVQPGNSGGSLVDMNGNVCGVIVARLDDFAALRTSGSLPQNVNYAIKGSVLRRFINESSEITLKKVQANSDSAVASARQAAAIVLVY
jgi:S1-C subfamily serine protease